ncbi:MAG: hypothetical protein JWL97_4547 [Gemmatimonadales bacterium]|nr:hypothetical protein [Gemmatimonadales bacterium]
MSELVSLVDRVRAQLAEFERLADELDVELGPHDEILHDDVLKLLAVVGAVAAFPAMAAALETDAGNRDPDSATTLTLNARARGLRDAYKHTTAALAAAGDSDD